MNNAVKYAVALGAVVALTACSGDSGSSGDLKPVPGPPSDAVVVVADEFSFGPDAVAVVAGPTRVEMSNEGSIIHDLRIEGIDDGFVEAGPGDIGERTVELEPGLYAFFCTIPGHRGSGMEGVLEVRAP